MLAECLVDHGFAVRQFISNVEHRSKMFRTAGHETRTVRPDYDIDIIPSSRYESNVSLARIRDERTFARNLLQAIRSCPRPDVVVLAEPAPPCLRIVPSRRDPFATRSPRCSSP